MNDKPLTDDKVARRIANAFELFDLVLAEGRTVGQAARRVAKALRPEEPAPIKVRRDEVFDAYHARDLLPSHISALAKANKFKYFSRDFYYPESEVFETTIPPRRIGLVRDLEDSK